MLQTIKKLVEDEFHIEDLSSRNRNQKYVDARTIYFMLCQRNTKFSLSRTAMMVNRHHATAIHAYKIYDQWVKCPNAFSYLLEALEKLDADIQNGIDEVSLEGDLLDIYRRKNEKLRLQVQSLLKKVEYQENKLKQYEKEELKY